MSWELNADVFEDTYEGAPHLFSGRKLTFIQVNGAQRFTLKSLLVDGSSDVSGALKEARLLGARKRSSTQNQLVVVIE